MRNSKQAAATDHEADTDKPRFEWGAERIARFYNLKNQREAYYRAEKNQLAGVEKIGRAPPSRHH